LPDLALHVHLRDGSVNGKNDGRNRTRVSAAKNLRANVASVALKSTKLMPSSTARAFDLLEHGSARHRRVATYTCPGITTRMGGG